MALWKQTETLVPFHKVPLYSPLQTVWCFIYYINMSRYKLHLVTFLAINLTIEFYRKHSKVQNMSINLESHIGFFQSSLRPVETAPLLPVTTG